MKSKDPMQVPSQDSGKQPAFPTDLAYRSATPISTAQDVTTAASTEDCWCDPVARQVKMSNEEQLAFRMKAFNAGEPWALDGQANELPHFQAGEIEDEPAKAEE